MNACLGTTYMYIDLELWVFDLVEILSLRVNLDKRNLKIFLS